MSGWKNRAKAESGKRKAETKHRNEGKSGPAVLVESSVEARGFPNPVGIAAFSPALADAVGLRRVQPVIPLNSEGVASTESDYGCNSFRVAVIYSRQTRGGAFRATPG